MRKHLLLFLTLGCSSEQAFIEPIYTPAFVPPPVIKNQPKATSKDTSWNEAGPAGFHFNRQVEFTTSQDTSAFRYGWNSEKFEVSYGECLQSDCQRTPVYERKEYGESDAGLAKEGDEYWYAWSFYVPVESTQPWAFFGQIMMPPRDNGGNHEPLWMFMKRSGEPFCMVFDFNRNRNAWVCNGATNKNIILLSEYDFAGKWHDIVLHIKFTTSDSGFTRVWVDGQPVGEYTGYTLLSDRKGAVMKYGIYRHSTPGSTIAYFDEMRKGKTREEVDIRLLTTP